jgi:uncharacterized protein
MRAVARTVGRLRAVLLLAVAVPLAGCAAMLGGYDLAPNGLTRDDDALRRALAFEAPRAYEAMLNGKGAVPEDPLLRLLFAGMAGRHGGSPVESSRLLDVASYLAEDRVTLSLSREALSLVTSDRSLAYVPTTTERLMIPYVAALNFLEAGKLDAAAVEARRIEALLDQTLDGIAPADRPRDAAFLHHFAAAIFEAAGDYNSADVSYRRAGRIDESLGRSSRTDGGGSDMAEVVVLVERGFAPHRVEQSVVIVLPPTQAAMLTDGSAADRAVAAAEAAARVLLTASLHFGDRSGFYRDPGYRSGLRLEPWRDEKGGDGGGDGTPYFLRMSWPVLFQDPIPAGPVRVRAGELGTDAIARFDVGSWTRRDFDAQRPLILARAVARAAAKLAVSAAVESSVGKRDEAAGQLAGLLANLGTAATERADTRCWHLLPGDISLVRLTLPAGTHELSLESGRPFATVVLEPGETRFVSTRLWR